jgi:hypothetical protein
MRGSVMLVALVVLRAANGHAQGVLSGVVREDSSGNALAGVEVLIEGTKHKATTDNSGRYVLGDLPTGNRVALFRFIGYRPARMRLNLSKGDTTRADATLVKERVQQLDPIAVTGTPAAPRGIGLESFEERRRLGIGKFIDSTELRRYDQLRASDVLRRFGVHIERMQDPRVTSPRFIQVASSGRKTVLTNNQAGLCLMQVILDGAELFNPAKLRAVPVDLSEFMTGSLAAIEVYASGAQTPIQFGGAGADCGTVVIWTRRR